MAFFGKVISKLGAALQKTRQTLTHGLKSVILGRRLDEALINDVERMLLEADVGTKATARIIESVRADFRAGTLKDSAGLLDHLKADIKRLLQPTPPSPSAQPTQLTRPHVILITGINGAGKTTSIAKLVKRYRDEGKSVLLGACDTFRAGAVKQLEVWGERLGVDVIKGQPGADPASVAFDACKAAAARNVDILIIDTAGRLQTQEPLMKQLAKIRTIIAKQIEGAPHETLLVLDATTGQNAIRQAEEFNKTSGGGGGAGVPPAAGGSSPTGAITGIILAKLDGTAKGGVVIAIRAATDIPVQYIGTGERPEDLEPFDPEAFVEAMFAE